MAFSFKPTFGATSTTTTTTGDNSCGRMVYGHFDTETLRHLGPEVRLFFLIKKLMLLLLLISDNGLVAPGIDSGSNVIVVNG